MKKLLVLILAFLYISTSSGAVLHFHYCMGTLADWGFSSKESRLCGKCGMEKPQTKKNGCCKDEQKILTNNTDQKASEPAYQLLQVAAVITPNSFFEISTMDFPSAKEKNPVSHAPPRSNVAVYIRNSVFLI